MNSTIGGALIDCTASDITGYSLEPEYKGYERQLIMTVDRELNPAESMSSARWCSVCVFKSFQPSLQVRVIPTVFFLTFTYALSPLFLVEFDVTAVFTVKGNNIISENIAFLRQTNPHVSNQPFSLNHFSTAFRTLLNITFTHGLTPSLNPITSETIPTTIKTATSTGFSTHCL